MTKDKRQDKHRFNDDRPDKKPSNKDIFYVFGVHPVEEALKNMPGGRLLIARNRNLPQLADLAERQKIAVESVEAQIIDELAGDTLHQGVVYALSSYRYAELDHVLENATKTPLVIILDQIKDPHNLGAIIRTCAGYDATCVIIPKDKAAQVTATVVKVSAGMAFCVPVVRVTNIAMTLRELKKQGFRILGAAADGEDLLSVSFDTPTALVMGNEGSGIRHLTRNLCDGIVRISHNPVLESLNVSVATGVILHEAFKSRKPY